MRRALNENPVVQAVVIGIMALLVAFLLFTRVLNQGGGDEAPAEPAATAAPTAFPIPAAMTAANGPPGPTPASAVSTSTAGQYPAGQAWNRT